MEAAGRARRRAGADCDCRGIFKSARRSSGQSRVFARRSGSPVARRNSECGGEDRTGGSGQPLLRRAVAASANVFVYLLRRRSFGAERSEGDVWRDTNGRSFAGDYSQYCESRRRTWSGVEFQRRNSMTNAMKSGLLPLLTASMLLLLGACSINVDDKDKK